MDDPPHVTRLTHERPLPKVSMTSLALLLCAARLAAADPAPDTKEAIAAADAPPAEGDLRYEATLRTEYLAGRPVLVPIRVWNAGSVARSAPDIERRPWLVSFTFDQGKGELERRRTTPPASDAGREVQLAPRSQRRTLLEIPASSALKPAEYSLQVTLDPDTIPKPLATDTIRLAQPNPGSADMALGTSAASRSSRTTVWLHKATEGFDLYLSPMLEARGRVPARWVAHLDSAVTPMLTESSGGAEGARHVVWARGSRGFQWLPLEGPGSTPQPRLVETPWPEIELVGRPATDASGNLHVPIWIPAPKGSGGEVRVVTVLDRGAVSYRRAATFKARPLSIATTVDDAGAVQLLVGTSDAVDLYTVRPTGSAHADLPVPGRRIARAAPGVPYIDVRFGLRASAGEQKGGLSVVATSRVAEGVQSTWLGLQGTELERQPVTTMPDGASLAAVLPGSTGTIGYMFKTGARSARFVEGERAATLDDSLHGDWAVVRRSDDTAAVVRTAKNTIFVTQPIVFAKP